VSWVVFSCAFPDKSRSAPRVAVWRRLRRAGAVSPKGGLYVLPATDDCIETVQWLAQEARTEGADPLVMRVEAFEGLTDAQLVALFREARRADYEALGERVAALELSIDTNEGERRPTARAALEKLREEYRQVRRIDYFDAPDGRQFAARLDALGSAISEPASAPPEVHRVSIGDFQGRRWVTRPRPFVDRLACAWLIRRFIDPTAEIRYASRRTGDDVAFDMGGGEFRHLGNRCTFEVMVAAFGLDAPGLRAIGEIVHEIDLHDGRFARPEVTGIEAVLAGWRDGALADEEIEAAGLRLFDGLLTSLHPPSAPRTKRTQP
jgi:hypothetical protein